MKMFTLGLLALCLVIGCSPHVPTLDEEIANQPDEWGMGWQFGASSNNWALLARVVAVEDVQERIRLVTALQAHFRHPPEQLLADCGKGTVFRNNAFRMRIAFASSCADRLIRDRNSDPAALFAGWRLRALWLDDLERLIELTEQEWNGGKGCPPEWNEPPNKAEIRMIALVVRGIYKHYFTYDINFAYTYRELPESVRPAFVEQIKRDFFNRPGMKYVDSPQSINWKERTVFPTEVK